MKWIAIIAIGVIGYMVINGNMGGSNKATQNYSEVMRGK